MAKTSPMTIIAVIVVVAILAGGSLITAFSDLFGQGWETWQDLWDFGDVSGQTGQTVGVGITIHYADGTTEEYEPKDEYKLIPLTVLLGEKEIESIEFFASCKILYSGTLDTVWASGEFTAENAKWETTIYSEHFSQTVSEPVPSGEWFGIAYLPVSASAIEDSCGHSDQIGIFGNLNVEELKIKMDSGETKTFSGTAQSKMVVFVDLYTSTIESISLEVNSNILYQS